MSLLRFLWRDPFSFAALFSSSKCLETCFGLGPLSAEEEIIHRGTVPTTASGHFSTCQLCPILEGFPHNVNNRHLPFPSGQCWFHIQPLLVCYVSKESYTFTDGCLAKRTSHLSNLITGHRSLILTSDTLVLAALRRQPGYSGKVSDRHN